VTPIEAFLDILRDEGVSRIFGNPGTTELPLISALAEVSDVEYVLALQEMSAVAMADGYARATGQPSVVNLHVAAGVANGLIGMLNASRSRTPMVVTAGQQDRRHLLQDPMLSGDLVRLASAAVKHAAEVQHAQDLPVMLRRAFALATQPPAGPVFLSIPMDLLAEDTDVEVPERSHHAGMGVAAGIDYVAGILAKAERPAIVAGDGVGRDHAMPELVEFAERLGATVYHQPMHDGINFPGTHPLYAGMLMPANQAIRDSLKRHDLVFIVGCHAFMPHHYTPGPAIPDGMTVVQLDTDPGEPGRNFAVTGMVGALGPTLAALTAKLQMPATLPWIERPELQVPDGLDPSAIAHAIASGLPEDAVVVEEAITVGMKLRQVLRLDRPLSYVHTIGGGLGWGIGAAIGTRMGTPDRPVVAVLGDGCAMFGIQGLWSAAHYNVPVTFLVMNNGEYRTLKDTLDNTTKPHRYVGLDLSPPALDWTVAAAFFGVKSLRVNSAKELRDVIAVPADEPLLIDVPVRGH
jgi:benzoylformate decarboxylase